MKSLLCTALMMIILGITGCGRTDGSTSSVKDDDPTVAGPAADPSADLDAAMGGVDPSACGCGSSGGGGAGLLDDFTTYTRPDLVTSKGSNYYAVVPASDSSLLQATLPTLQSLPPGTFAVVRHGGPGVALGDVPTSAIPPGTRAIVDFSCYGASSSGGTSQALYLAQQTGLPVYAAASTVYPDGSTAGGWLRVTPDGSQILTGQSNIGGQ